ncbi:MAG: hypothetical protein KAJ75_04075, partial [Alphaproteobacteria bacterium]|nr:hypothetical protein [Alphaproteobacteria bacterium]
IEKLLLKNPDILIFDTDENKTPALAGQMLKHPAIVNFAKTKKTVTLPAKYWSCGAPAVIDIVEKLHKAPR